MNRSGFLTAVAVALAAAKPALAAKQPVGGAANAFYVGGTADCATGQLVNLPWRFNNGAALLDATDPLNPSVVAAGLYAFNLIVQLADLPASGSAVGQVQIFDPTGASISGTFDLAIPGAMLPLTIVWNCPAGTVVNAQVANRAATTKTFALTACVQKIP